MSKTRAAACNQLNKVGPHKREDYNVVSQRAYEHVFKKGKTCNPGQTSVANSHKAKFVVNLSTSYFHKVSPVNVNIITPYKDIWKGFSSQGKHIPF